MAWLVPENKLDEQQRDFIDNVDFNQKNIWIKGFPGSGKSVLLAYSLKKILRNKRNSNVVIIVFTRSLIEMFKAALNEMELDAPVITFYDFMKSGNSYDYILCDEVQDLVPSVLKEFNNRANHVIVAGDENQSIYESDPKYHENTVSPYQINDLLNTRSFELGIIHRLSSSIIGVIQRFLPNLNIFSAKRDLTKQTTQVRLCEGDNTKEEVDYIFNEASKATRIGDSSAILLPKSADIIKFVNQVLRSNGKREWNQSVNHWGALDYGSLNRHLAANGIQMKYVGNGYGNLSSNDKKVVIMTYHSSKGLDFDNVFLPFVNSSLFIVPNETLSKTLFMVAMTRSRNNLYLTYSGYKHHYLNAFQDQCSNLKIHNRINSASINTTNYNNSSSSGSANVFGI